MCSATDDPTQHDAPAGIVVPTEGRPTSPTSASDLLGAEANAFFIMGHTAKVLRRAGASADYIKAYQADATAADYDHLLAVSMAYLDAGPTEE